MHSLLWQLLGRLLPGRSTLQALLNHLCHLCVKPIKLNKRYLPGSIRILFDILLTLSDSELQKLHYYSLRRNFCVISGTIKLKGQMADECHDRFNFNWGKQYRFVMGPNEAINWLNNRHDMLLDMFSYGWKLEKSSFCKRAFTFWV